MPYPLIFPHSTVLVFLLLFSNNDSALYYHRILQNAKTAEERISPLGNPVHFAYLKFPLFNRFTNFFGPMGLNFMCASFDFRKSQNRKEE